MKAGKVPDGTEIVIYVNGLALQGIKISAAPNAPYIKFPYLSGIWVSKDRELEVVARQPQEAR